MTESSPATTEPAGWPGLSLHERRVLGVLVEKAKTTPDAYPMSLNGLVTGSNQKSNRDPALNLTDVDVEEALLSAQKKGLVKKLISSGRVERWKHELYEVWHVDKVELAVLAELLLRGPQTEGELRGRASRMEPIDDLEALRAVLKPLVERKLVVYLTPEGRRGTILSHGFHAPDELAGLRRRHGEGSEPSIPAVHANPPAVSEDEVAKLRADLGDVRSQVSEMQTKLADLAKQVHDLKAALGA